VPEKDAKKVMIQLTGIRHKGRTVRCNDADEGGKVPEGKKSSKQRRPKKDNWRELMNKSPRDLKGSEPDFSEEGWAMRKPRKKKK
jgi:ATP-dependent RNA helicase DeaD